MKLYRGQTYGAPVGEWWTADREDAQNFARSRGPKAWVVLEVEVDARKLRRHLFDRHQTRISYKIPRSVLKQHMLAVRVLEGAIEL